MIKLTPAIKLKDKQMKELEETIAWYFKLEKEIAQLRYVQDEIASQILLMRTSEWYWINKKIRDTQMDDRVNKKGAYHD